MIWGTLDFRAELKGTHIGSAGFREHTSLIGQKYMVQVHRISHALVQIGTTTKQNTSVLMPGFEISPSNFWCGEKKALF